MHNHLTGKNSLVSDSILTFFLNLFAFVHSDAAVSLTLWGADAEGFNDYGQPVLLVKAGRVTEFGGGKSISIGNSSVLKKNPDVSEGHYLRGWFDNGGGREIRNSVSAQSGGGGGNYAAEWLTFHEAKLKNLGNGDKADYFQIKGIISLIRSANIVYKACPQDPCKKKVIDMQNGQYRCETCNIESANFKYRMILNVCTSIFFLISNFILHDINVSYLL